MYTDRPASPELVVQWIELQAAYRRKEEELVKTQEAFDASLVNCERLLAVPQGGLAPWELVDARMEMRWAVCWRDNTLADLKHLRWKMELLDATDSVLQLYARLGNKPR